MTLTTRLTPKSDPNRAIVAPATTESTVASRSSTPSQIVHDLTEELRFDGNHGKGRFGRRLRIAVGDLDAVSILEFETALGAWVAGDDLPRVDKTLTQQSLHHGLAHHAATDKRQGLVSQCHCASGIVKAQGNTKGSGRRINDIGLKSTVARGESLIREGGNQPRAEELEAPTRETRLSEIGGIGAPRLA